MGLTKEEWRLVHASHEQFHNDMRDMREWNRKADAMVEEILKQSRIRRRRERNILYRICGWFKDRFNHRPRRAHWNYAEDTVVNPLLNDKDE